MLFVILQEMYVLLNVFGILTEVYVLLTRFRLFGRKCMFYLMFFNYFLLMSCFEEEARLETGAVLKHFLSQTL